MNTITRNIMQSMKSVCTLLLVAVLIPASVNAADNWEYETSANFEGKGTADNPYLIQNAQDLASLAYEVSKGTLTHNEYDGKYFKQTADIVLNDNVLKTATLDAYGRYQNGDALSKLKDWIPIGIYGRSFNSESPYWFKGHYDGNGHSISGIYCYRGVIANNITKGDGYDNYLGLFGAVQGGSIKNLTLKDCLIRVRDVSVGSGNEWRYIGTIVGRAKNEELSNCAVESSAICFDMGNLSTQTSVGGIIGYSEIDKDNNKDYVLSECSFSGWLNVFNDDSQCSPSIGGICGSINAAEAYLSSYKNPTLSNCIARGMIAYNYNNIASARKESAVYTGGILGRFIHSDQDLVSYAELYRCTNFINMEIVSKESDVYAGGVAGYMARCQQSANFGNIYINKNGGKVKTVNAGGIGSFASVDNCVNYGAVELGSSDHNAAVSEQAYLAGLAVCGLGNAASSSNSCSITNSAVCSSLYYSDTNSGRCHADPICVFGDNSGTNAYYHSKENRPTLYGKAKKQEDATDYQKYSDLLDILNTNAKRNKTSPNIWGQLDNSESSFHRYIMPFAIGAAPAARLDENSNDVATAISDNLYDGTNTMYAKVLVTLVRTLHKDKWNTICLPFSMSAADLKTYFGDGVKLEKLSGATMDGSGTLTLSFASSAELVAGTPYLIKPSAVSNNNNTYLIESRPLEKKSANSTTSTVNGGEVNMNGNYDKMTLTGDKGGYEQYFLQNDKFYHIVPSNPLTAKGFRCYFTVSDGVTVNKAMVRHDDNSTTAINVVEVGTSADGSKKIYDLQGIEYNGMPKGIYIKNGKKYCAK